jgi:ribonuclease HII
MAATLVAGATVLIAGVDEAGRGPLAGPVTAAAVILDPEDLIVDLADSKRLSAARRAALEAEVTRRSLSWSVAWASVAEIDRLNILEATLLAMQRAVAALEVVPGCALIDGNRCPRLPCRTEGVVGGDARVPAISAASILAKEARDREMRRLDRLYPGYGLARHKGYPTREHLAALLALGPSPAHRRSFGPVRSALAPGRS